MNIQFSSRLRSAVSEASPLVLPLSALQGGQRRIISLFPGEEDSASFTEKASQDESTEPTKKEPGSLLDDPQMLTLSDPVTEETAEGLSSALLSVSQVKKADGGNVKLLIKSPGGSYDDGLRIVDTMENLGRPVDTLILGGTGASMAALLFLAGSTGRRFMSRNAKLMIHQPRGGIMGTANEIALKNAEFQRVRARVDQFISRKTGIPLSQIQDMTDRDTVIYPLEALKLGFTDWVLVGQGNKALNAESIKDLSLDEVKKRDDSGDYEGLSLFEFDPALGKNTDGPNLFGGGGAASLRSLLGGLAGTGGGGISGLPGGGGRTRRILIPLTPGGGGGGGRRGGDGGANPFGDNPFGQDADIAGKSGPGKTDEPFAKSKFEVYL